MKQKSIKKTAGAEAGKLYFTSDNLSFFDEASAMRHAATLADTCVTAKTMEEVNNEVSALLGDDWDDLSEGEDSWQNIVKNAA